ncbi:helix-turn-helix domain-containing protein [Streptococcus hyointestinalis]|uniref:helix-turn-helix domain-containing protein n=1 Tax=Streptococcus hyointestinalis TaxID=1337 RepID=UPI003D056C5B
MDITIKNNLRRLRTANGLTQDELTEALNKKIKEIGKGEKTVSKMTISNWENNKHAIKSDKAELLADYFGVSVAYLLGYSEYKVPEDYFEIERKRKTQLSKKQLREEEILEKKVHEERFSPEAIEQQKKIDLKKSYLNMSVFFDKLHEEIANTAGAYFAKRDAGMLTEEEKQTLPDFLDLLEQILDTGKAFTEVFFRLDYAINKKTLPKNTTDKDTPTD